MITQAGYSFHSIDFCNEFLFLPDNIEDDYGQYHRCHLISLIPENVYEDRENYLDKLNPNDYIYTSSESDYIKRYQKFAKWFKENLGKKFIALVPSYATNATRFANMKSIYIPNKHFCFERSFRNDIISFLTDYELVELSPNATDKQIKKILESIIISRVNKPLQDYDYRGRSVV